MEKLFEIEKILNEGKSTNISKEGLEEIIGKINEDQIKILKMLKDGPSTRKEIAEEIGESKKTVGRRYSLLKQHDLITTGKGKPAKITDKGDEFFRRILYEDEAKANVIYEVISTLDIVPSIMDIGESEWRLFNVNERTNILKSFLFSDRTESYLAPEGVKDFDTISRKLRKNLFNRLANLEREERLRKQAKSIDSELHQILRKGGNKHSVFGISKKEVRTTIGDRLEGLVGNILKNLEVKGCVSSLDDYTPNRSLPDFVINGNIGVECKNWDPNKKNKLSYSGFQKKIQKRFSGYTGYKERILIISYLQYTKSGKKKAKSIIDKNYTVFSNFPWISASDKDREKAKEKIKKWFRKWGIRKALT